MIVRLESFYLALYYLPHWAFGPSFMALAHFTEATLILSAKTLIIFTTFKVTKIATEMK